LQGGLGSHLQAVACFRAAQKRLGWQPGRWAFNMRIFMLIRTSAKFRRQYRCAIEETDPAARPFPQTWNVDLISNGPRQLLVIASEEFTLFSVLVSTGRGRNMNMFLEAFRERLLKLFEDTGIHSGGRPDLNQFTFVGRTDKRIIGSQNDLIYLARCHLAEMIQPATPNALREVERGINDSPMSYLGMDYPLRAFQKKTEWLKADIAGNP
jgi:hypothetical protein